MQSSDAPQHTLAARPSFDAQRLLQPGGARARVTRKTSAATKNIVSNFFYTIAHDSQVVRLQAENQNCAAFAPCSKLLASGGYFGTISLWNAHVPETEIATLQTQGSQAMAMEFSPDGKFLAVAFIDQIVILWDVHEQKEVCTLRGHTGFVFCVTFSPDGRLLASGSEDCCVRVWNVASALQGSGSTAIATITPHSRNVLCVAFSADGALLASCSLDGTIAIQSVDGAQIRQVAVLRNTSADGGGGSDSVVSVAFSPDGRLLASGGFDKCVRLWSCEGVRFGVLVAVLLGHADIVNSVAFSPDGCLLASGSYDFTVKIWRLADVPHAREVASVHTGFLYANTVAFSKDGKKVLMALNDGYESSEIGVWGQRV